MSYPPTTADMHCYVGEYDLLALVESFDPGCRAVRWDHRPAFPKPPADFFLHDPKRVPHADREKILAAIGRQSPIVLIWLHRRVGPEGLPLQYYYRKGDATGNNGRDITELRPGFDPANLRYSLPTSYVQAKDWTERQMKSKNFHKLEKVRVDVLPVGNDVISGGKLVGGAAGKKQRRELVKDCALPFVKNSGYFAGYCMVWKGETRESSERLAERMRAIFDAYPYMTELDI